MGEVSVTPNKSGGNSTVTGVPDSYGTPRTGSYTVDGSLGTSHSDGEVNQVAPLSSNRNSTRVRLVDGDSLTSSGNSKVVKMLDDLVLV
jgi:hypothetical protein